MTAKRAAASGRPINVGQRLKALARALHGLLLHIEAENMPRLAHQRAEALGVVTVAEGGVDGRGAFVQGVEYKALRPAAGAAEI